LLVSLLSGFAVVHVLLHNIPEEHQDNLVLEVAQESFNLYLFSIPAFHVRKNQTPVGKIQPKGDTIRQGPGGGGLPGHWFEIGRLNPGIPIGFHALYGHQDPNYDSDVYVRGARPMVRKLKDSVS
jgi:hypothetical protein